MNKDSMYRALYNICLWAYNVYIRKREKTPKRTGGNKETRQATAASWTAAGMIERDGLNLEKRISSRTAPRVDNVSTETGEA